MISVKNNTEIRGLGRPHTEVDIGDRLLKARLFEVPVIKRYVESGRILDFGCGSGELLSLFKECGYDVYGFDPSGGSIEFARARFCFGENLTSIEDEVADNFDAITVIQVLQYAFHRGALLNDIISRLKVGGILFIEKTNKQSLYGFFMAKREAYEIYSNPVHASLTLMSIERGAPAYWRLSDKGLKKIVKKIFLFFDTILWFCGIRVSDNIILIYKKTR